jgi:two-component system chemotaxis response regulator CheB
MKAIVIGGSAGGIDAINQILPLIPEGFTIPILMVQHIQNKFHKDFGDTFRRSAKIKVIEACAGEPITNGFYICPPGYHLLVEKNQTISLSLDEPVNYSRPSIDVLFETAAEAYQNNLAGILLSGASADGAAGLKMIKDYGGITIVQDPATASSPTMPKAGMSATKVDKMLSPTEIGRFLASIQQEQVD